MSIKFNRTWLHAASTGIAVICYVSMGMAQTPSPLTGNGATGNILSRWFDRTPAIDQLSPFPPAGEDCAMIYDPLARLIVLFGGKNDDDQNLNEVWALDLAKNLWQKIEGQGEQPPSSEDHAVIYDPLDYRMILHGGEDGLTTNKTWSFDLKKHHWSDMTDSTAPAREDHSAIFDSRGRRMVIWGGRDKDSTYDHINLYDMWALDLDPNSPTFEKWQDLSVEEQHAPGRSDHVAVYDSTKNRMVIYGGWDKEMKEYFGDTWAFYFAPTPDTKGRWRQIKTKKSHPPKRRRAVGVYDSARNWFIVCGGFGQEGYLNDVWAFDLTRDVWMNVTPGPQPRIDHQAVYDPTRGRLILYGGDAQRKTKFHDLWELHIQSYEPADSLQKSEADISGKQ